jgi:dipeptidyl aminopeptidase/acylaminoacyl peptidase
MKGFNHSVFGLLLIASVHAGAQVMTPELLWQLKRVGSPLVSPDNKTILFTVSEYSVELNKGETDIYSLPVNAASGNVPKRVTSYPGGEMNVVWRPDGKKFAFLSAINGDAQVYEADADGSNVQRVTNYPGGLNGFVYSADGNTLVFIADVRLDSTLKEKYPDLPKANVHVFDDLMYRHWNAWHDYSYSHVFYVRRNSNGVFDETTDIMNGERFDAPLQPMGGMEQITVSADGNQIIYTSKKLAGKKYAQSTNSELYRFDVKTGKTENITEKGYEGYDVNPVFSPSGKKLAWLSMARNGFEADKNDIIVRDLVTGSDMNPTATMDITVSTFVWSDDETKVYFEAVTEGTQQLFSIELKTGKITQLTKGDHNYTSVDDATTHLLAARNDMLVPSEIYRVNLKTGAQEKITSFNDEILSGLKKPEFEKRWITTTDGKKMLTWVVLPPAFDKTKKYPTLLYCQGGPQSAVSQFFSYRWNFHLMAAQGFVVVAPNRRGLPGFGQKWNDQISNDWGGQAITDYLTAIDTLAKEAYVDKDKLAAVGASYGGYSVYQLAGVHNKRFKAFISHCGLFNLESWYGTTEELFFANWDIGGPYWETPVPESYAKFSPHKLVGNWDTPILVIHGEKDFRVPVNQGMEAFQAAQLKGIPSKFLYFPTEGHWVLGAQNGLVWHREFFEWLNTYL